MIVSKKIGNTKILTRITLNIPVHTMEQLLDLFIKARIKNGKAPV